MKIFKLDKILLLTVISISVSADYDSDKFNNYISEQGVNEVLKEAQEIICIVGKLGTEQLAIGESHHQQDDQRRNGAAHPGDKLINSS
jgi:hypothetical protein